MSAELLNLYTNSLLPPEFTPLDRHLLEHYCNRQIDNLGKAFIGMSELVRITGCVHGSVLRSRARLKKAGVLIQVTKGYPGQCSEFRVSKEFLLNHQLVTEGLPVSRNKVTAQSQQITAVELTSNSGETHKSPSSYPIQENNKTKKQQGSSYSLQLLEAIPLKYRFAITETIEELLLTLESQGTSFKAIEGALRTADWDGMRSPKAVVTQLLRDLATRVPDYSPENKPKWCGSCNEETRKTDYPSPLPNGNGAITYSCLACDPYMVSTYGNKAKSIQKITTN
jgi:hypothetical protein